jgi:hypothetical protein
MVPARERDTDFANARFTIRAVIAIVGFMVMIVGGQWATYYSLQSTMTSLGFRMDAKDKADAKDEATRKEMEERDAQARKREEAAAEKIWNDRLQALDEKINRVEREYKTADYDLKATIGKR